MKYKKTLPLLAILFLYSPTNIEASDRYRDEIDKDWEIVSKNTHTHEDTGEEDDTLLSLKAFGNTAVSVLGGIALNILERTVQQKADQFTSGMNAGLNYIGNSYGQGLAFRYAYENEKQSLKEKR